MTLLVTGAAGFIGSNMCRRLLKEGHTVFGIDNLNTYYSPRRKILNVVDILDDENFTFVYGDIADRDFLQKTFRGIDVDAVVHIAARAGVRPSIEKPMWYEEANIQATINLYVLAAQKKAQNFVYTSSSSVYGDIKDHVPDEEHSTDKPLSPYAASKKAGELYAHTFGKLFGIPSTVVRLFNVYGPYGRPDTAIPKFIHNVHHGEKIEQFTSDTSSRAYTHVDDVVEGIVRVLENPKPYEIYNLGNDVSTTLKDVIETVEDVVGTEATVEVIGKQQGEIEHTRANSEKALEDLGWEPRIGFKEGVQSVYDWFLSFQTIKDEHPFLPGITKRILIFSKSYVPFVAGAETAVLKVTEKVDHHHYHVITVRHGDLPAKERVGNTMVHRVGFGGPVSRLLYPLFAIEKAIHIRKSFTPSIAWGIMTGPAGIASLLYKLLFPTTKLYISLQDTRSARKRIKRTFGLHLLIRPLYRFADGIHSISHSVAAEVKKFGFCGEVDVIPNGAEISLCKKQYSQEYLAQKKASAGFDPDDTVVITVSPLKKESGVDILIRSLEHLPSHIKLHIVGNGPQESYLRHLVAQKKLKDRVVFSEYPSAEERVVLIKAADVFVRPARTEGLSMSFLEAMACGTPVIGTAAGGLKEFLVHKETALVTRKEDPQDTAAKIEEILEDKVLREILTENSLRLVVRDYDWEVVSEKMKKVFDNL